MYLYFVRHGESEANLLNEFSNRGLKHGLTAKGREQSLELAKGLGHLPIRKLFTSPLLRSVQTAQVLGYAFNQPYEVTDALREYDCGVLEGKSDPASWSLYAEVFDAWIIDHQWDRRIEGGESFYDFQARFLPFLDGLVQAYERFDVNVVLVGHGGLYRCMLPLVLENVDIEYAARHLLDNTEYVLAEAINGRIDCLEWGQQLLR